MKHNQYVPSVCELVWKKGSICFFLNIDFVLENNQVSRKMEKKTEKLVHAHTKVTKNVNFL